MNIDKFKDEDGGYLYKGISYEDAEDFLGSFFGFCGCGRPDVALKYMRDCMSHILELEELVWEKKMSYDDWEKKQKSLYINEGAMYAIYYLLSDKDITEHGGGVPGWLSNTVNDTIISGKQILSDLKEMYPE